MAIVKSKLLKQLSKNYPNFLKRDLKKFINIILDEIKKTLKRKVFLQRSALPSLARSERSRMAWSVSPDPCRTTAARARGPVAAQTFCPLPRSRSARSRRRVNDEPLYELLHERRLGVVAGVAQSGHEVELQLPRAQSPQRRLRFLT